MWEQWLKFRVSQTGQGKKKLRTLFDLRIGQHHPHLWRAVDQDGNVLDIFVQSRRNKKGGQAVFQKTSQRVAVRATRGHHR
jgi:putative transposase